MVADSDGEMESHDLDVKYPAIFSAYDRLVKISFGPRVHFLQTLLSGCAEFQFCCGHVEGTPNEKDVVCLCITAGFFLLLLCKNDSHIAKCSNFRAFRNVGRKV